MGLRINTNIEAFNAHRNLTMTSWALSRSMERLSSGLRINRAADDPAGLGISEKMRAQIRGIQQAQRNAHDGVSLVQTAEGAMQEMHSILHRIRDLAVQYNNGTLSTTDKAAITAEVYQLNEELDRMIGAASFNGINLLEGTATVTLQIGANNGETVVVASADVQASLGTEIDDFADGTITVGGTVDIDAIDAAISALATDRSRFGAVQNRLEHTISFLGVYQENLQSAESRIRDVDMAYEMVNFTRLQILQQSGTAMLAQANMQHQTVLSLLK